MGAWKSARGDGLRSEAELPVPDPERGQSPNAHFGDSPLLRAIRLPTGGVPAHMLDKRVELRPV
jgi:hypothetical protein